ncbi:Putative acetyltransferase [Kitasatospora sp. MMS16-BH015]|uniref:GNAT family N-acetyltransferase n=1 Tax=Kitasatospora sp. MMS16-BH015 TaxID=2018025 RepID=UPI000CA19334|nr:GNAT family N-acetyltransferase [Kitasatospora sp. MMS16-BH015]AUG76010.1 Putative acetyltransferase [Kitasatospora sp. MMS16-BH015]
MTTTLRPEHPEEPTPDGGRTRRWQICVNGRPVGGLRTTAQRYGEQWWGEISELAVSEGHRRGRATVGALAAEEVLRGWGCTRVDVSVPGGAEPALRLAEMLGYTERMRNMAKPLAHPPQLAPGLTARPIEGEAYRAWRSVAVADYAAELRKSGLTADQARAKADADDARFLPQGADTPHMAMRELSDPAGAPVGTLWVALHQEARPQGGWLAWVMTVDVDPAQRGRGYGRALLQLAERECLAAGVHELGLNVFSDNAVAINLYESLGYAITRRILGKAL